VCFDIGVLGRQGHINLSMHWDVSTTDFHNELFFYGYRALAKPEDSYPILFFFYIMVSTNSSYTSRHDHWYWSTAQLFLWIKGLKNGMAFFFSSFSFWDFWSSAFLTPNFPFDMFYSSLIYMILFSFPFFPFFPWPPYILGIVLGLYGQYQRSVYFFGFRTVMDGIGGTGFLWVVMMCDRSHARAETEEFPLFYPYILEMVILVYKKRD
jgi:hypothetical protein